MRALPYAIILTKAVISMMAKGCIVARVLHLGCFLFLLPCYTHIYAIIMQYLSYTDKSGVLQQEYSQPPILPYPHFRWVVLTDIPFIGITIHKTE